MHNLILLKICLTLVLADLVGIMVAVITGTTLPPWMFFPLLAPFAMWLLMFVWRA